MRFRELKHQREELAAEVESLRQRRSNIPTDVLRVRTRLCEALAIEDGALYTALHRLEKSGLLKSTWGLSETNRRAKYYSLTAKGRRVLREQTETWRRNAAALFKVLDGKSRKATP